MSRSSSKCAGTASHRSSAGYTPSARVRVLIAPCSSRAVLAFAVERLRLDAI